MVVEDSQVEGTETVRLPGVVEEQATGEVDTLDAQAVDVVERIHHTLKITSMSELGGLGIVLPRGSICVVV
jgi:hypothetical protein